MLLHCISGLECGVDNRHSQTGNTTCVCSCQLTSYLSPRPESGRNSTRLLKRILTTGNAEPVKISIQTSSLPPTTIKEHISLLETYSPVGLRGTALGAKACDFHALCILLCPWVGATAYKCI